MKNKIMAPDLSFLGQPQTEVSEADIVFLGVPLDVSSSYLKGSAQAPNAIFGASCELEEWDLILGLDPFSYLTQHSLILDVQNTKEALGRDLELVRDFASSLPKSTLVLGVGGNHSISPSLVQARMSKPGTVIQVDAHLDLRDEYDGTPYSHACPMKRLFDDGHQLIQVGIRSGEKEEARFADAHRSRITTFYDHDWSHESKKECLNLIRDISGPVYLTVDVDGLEPQLCPGTGTPLPGGLSWRDLVDLIRATFEAQDAHVCGADVVECIPTPNSAINESVAASVLFRIAAHAAARSRD